MAGGAREARAARGPVLCRRRRDARRCGLLRPQDSRRGRNFSARPGRSGAEACSAGAVFAGFGVASSAFGVGSSFGVASSTFGVAGSGGWVADADVSELLFGVKTRCDIDVIDATDLDADTFERRYRAQRPVLIAGGAADWPARARWHKAALVDAYGDRPTQCGAGSDVVYAGGGSTGFTTLRALVDRLSNVTGEEADDVFSFDVGVMAAIPELSQDFRTPAALQRTFPAALRAGGAAWRLLSLGPARGGLPLHAHGETWLAVVHGAKRWFAYAPGKGPSRETLAKIHPLASTLHWARAVEDAALTAPAEAPLSCVQNAGDVVYLPAGWKHATLNLAETIAVGEQASYPAQERLATALGALRLNPHDVEALHGAGVATAHRAFETGATRTTAPTATLSRSRHATARPDRRRRGGLPQRGGVPAPRRGGAAAAARGRRPRPGIGKPGPPLQGRYL
ncbi:hypothetical protein M885DRAFT_46804 [Pelagophyceae sp. CCMP2097]|nr:hypothetical protein M885DRAFT_46804 [Pelagophyceae sp. CCMP2097]